MSTTTETLPQTEATQEMCEALERALQSSDMEGVRTFIVRIRNGLYAMLGRALYYREKTEAEKIAQAEAENLGIQPQQIKNDIEVLSWEEAQIYPVKRQVEVSPPK